MTISQRLSALRERMEQEHIDVYYIPTEDFHCSEYVGDYFKSREWISGFTGSAGSVVITQEHAGLWTDGRYFLQAEAQLADSGIQLYRMGEPDVPSVQDFIVDTMSDGQTLGMDGRTVTILWLDTLQRRFGRRNVSFRTDVDLIDDIWSDRPAMSCEPVWELDIRYAGRTRAEKLRDVREALAQNNADWLLLSSLDDIAWLLNLRGNDVEFNPVFLSHIAVSADEARLFIQSGAVSDDIRSALSADGIECFEYGEIADFLNSLSDCIVQLDRAKTSCSLVRALGSGGKNVRILPKPSPTVLPKACKNPVEVENIYETHRKDGAAIVQFLHWLKTNVGCVPMTEISVADKLEDFRKQQEHYIEPSFGPISAYADHGAIVHYSATAETNYTLKPEGFILLDTGGQYLEGTTDITRTVALGELTEAMKRHYTAVLRGNLKLAAAVFRSGCTGVNLDIIARQPLWEQGLDFNHGTGHGVGFLLCCHEGPQNIRWRNTPNAAVLAEGMVTSDEPGVYLTGEYGIRLENLLVCLKADQTEFGDFLRFDPLTLVPFDRDAIMPELMTAEERALLNAYHARVYEEISPRLDEADKKWLENATQPI